MFLRTDSGKEVAEIMSKLSPDITQKLTGSDAYYSKVFKFLFRLAQLSKNANSTGCDAANRVPDMPLPDIIRDLVSVAPD